MVRLQANAENAALAHGISTTRNIANLACREHEILIAHQLRNGCGHLGRDAPLESLQVSFGGLIVEDELAKPAHGHASDPFESRGIMRFENESGDLVSFGRNKRIVQQINQRQVGQSALCGDALTLRSGSDSGELIAGFFFICLREQLTEIGEVVAFAHRRWCLVWLASALKE